MIALNENKKVVRTIIVIEGEKKVRCRIQIKGRAVRRKRNSFLRRSKYEAINA